MKDLGKYVFSMAFGIFIMLVAVFVSAYLNQSGWEMTPQAILSGVISVQMWLYLNK